MQRETQPLCSSYTPQIVINQLNESILFVNMA